jgi:NADPH:quinone reductase-like Zn-dependent oxidoreductase
MRDAMQAVVYERYGSPDVLELRDVDKPTPGKGEVLVKVRAAGVAAGDWHMLTADFFAVRFFWGLFRPKHGILGWDVAGVVESAGKTLKPGDAVFGACENSRGGAFAEYVCVPEELLVPKPENVSFEEAAVVPVSALTALHGLRDKGLIREGHKVLINGASGGVGTFAVQVAKSFGAEVTAMTSSAKMDHARSVGADRVLDYTEGDFTTRDEAYDLVLDNYGKYPLAACKRRLSPGGIYVAVSGAPSRALRIALFGGKRAVAFVSDTNRSDLLVLQSMLGDGRIRPVIDTAYPLAGAPDALRRLETGEVRGKLVVTV